MQAGAETRVLTLASLCFDVHVHARSPEDQPLEPDLERARDWLAWAEHLVFVYPTWWGTMPALLKGFLDRMIMPGFAFRFYGPGASEWEGLWAGKSAQLITTTDTPPPVYRWLFRAPGTHAMRNATLGFCGVKPVHALVFGPVRTSSAKKREQWLERARRAGFALRGGVHRPAHRAWLRVRPWLKALRFQFYPMSWAAYTVGALAGVSGGLHWAPYLWGYLCLFCLEAATVFCNDYLDYVTDRANVHHGPFTGGSRVLVSGQLGFAQLRHGIGLMLILACLGAALAVKTSLSPTTSALWLVLAAILTLGYTAPPLKLSYRGLGELDVAFTHSALVLWLGYLLQGGAPGVGLPWLLALPLFLSILPAIILAGVPDRAADVIAGKHTLAERLGKHAAMWLAGAFILVAALFATVFDLAGVADGAFEGVRYAVWPHAALCLWLLLYYARRGAEQMHRIDGLLLAVLTYMVWFVAVPYYHLL